MKYSTKSTTISPALASNVGIALIIPAIKPPNNLKPASINKGKLSINIGIVLRIASIITGINVGHCSANA